MQRGKERDYNSRFVLILQLASSFQTRTAIWRATPPTNWEEEEEELFSPTKRQKEEEEEEEEWPRC